MGVSISIAIPAKTLSYPPPNLIFEPAPMTAPIITATLQSALISLLSCIIAQSLNPSNPPHITSLVLYAILSTPPNFLWQQYIESQFPGYTLKKVSVDDGGKGVEVEKNLNVWNTCVKVLLDQTIAAVVNVAAYIGVTRLLRGVPLEDCTDAVREVSGSCEGLGD